MEDKSNTKLISAFRIILNEDDAVYMQKFYTKEYWYIDVGEYKYWVIEDILNRALIKIGNPQ